MNYWLEQIRGLKTFLPSLSQVIANFPLLILFLWITFIFSIVVYFLGGAKDLEQKMGKGSITRLHVFLGVVALVNFLAMVSLAFYLILRPQ
jgi:energy-coupling factor transporter transmembrane protein EcfT